MTAGGPYVLERSLSIGLELRTAREPFLFGQSVAGGRFGGALGVAGGRDEKG